MEKKQDEILTNEEVLTEETTAEAAEQAVEEAAPATPSKAKKESKLKALFKQRKFRFGAVSVGITVAVIIACILLNVAASLIYERFPLSLDLTSDMIYTLSDESKAFADTVKKDVKVTVFMDEETVTGGPFGAGYEELNRIFMQFHEMAKQYESASDGHVTVEYVDLTANPTLAAQYEEYGATTYSILFQCEDRHRIISYEDLFTAEQTGTDYYTGGASYDYDSNVETILASQISLVTDSRDVSVTMLIGHEEDEYTVAGLKETLELNGYSFTDLNLTTQAEFPEDSTLAMIVGPTVDYTEEELTRLRSWLSNNGKLGRNLLVLLNPSVSISKMPNLCEFLEVDYGIEVTDNVVYETATDRLAVLNYNYNPYYVYADIAETEYTSSLTGKTAIACNTRQLIAHYENNTELSLYNVPVLTFPDTAMLMDMNNTDEDAEGVKASEYPINGMIMAMNTAYDNDTEGSPQVKTHVLVGGSSLLMDSYIMKMQQTQNESLTLQLFNGMSGNEGAKEISSKSVKQETLEFDANTQIVLGLWVFTIIIPAITLIICLIVFVKRKNL